MAAETATTENNPPGAPAPERPSNPFVQAILDFKAEQAARGNTAVPGPEEDPWADVPNYEED